MVAGAISLCDPLPTPLCPLCSLTHPYVPLTYPLHTPYAPLCTPYTPLHAPYMPLMHSLQISDWLSVPTHSQSDYWC